MANPYGAPEISPLELATKRSAGEALLVVDVREDWELDLAKLKGEFERCPLSALAERGAEAIPPALAARPAEVVVVCHHGIRSAEVTSWLLAQGYQNVRSLAGGLDAYAQDVDASIGAY